MSPGPSWVTWRVLLAAWVLWLSDLAWDLSWWLSGLAERIQEPGRRAHRGLARLGILAALAGAGLVAGAAPALRGTVERPGVEAGPELAPRPDPSASVAEGIARGCAAAGLEVTSGIQDGVWVMRCRRPVENLGVMPAPRKGARR